MQTNERVLVVVDPTREDEQECLKRGAWLASKLDLGLDLLICDYEPQLSSELVLGTPELSTLLKNAMKANFDALEEIAEPLRRTSLDVVVNSVWDNPLHDGIIRHVLRTNPSFVVKETHYHSLINRALFTNTDWNLVRQCPVPLWLAKQHDWPADGTILASVDPTNVDDKHAELDDEILDPAALLAKELGSELHAFHSYQSLASLPMVHSDAGMVYDAKIDKDIEEAHKKSIEKLLKNYPVAAENVHVMSGYPDRLLPDLADEINAGLVVMGSVARNALQRAFVGSTAERTLDRLRCDLLVVKPPRFKCRVLQKPARDYGAITDA